MHVSLFLVGTLGLAFVKASPIRRNDEKRILPRTPLYLNGTSTTISATPSVAINPLPFITSVTFITEAHTTIAKTVLVPVTASTTALSFSTSSSLSFQSSFVKSSTSSSQSSSSSVASSSTQPATTSSSTNTYSLGSSSSSTVVESPTSFSREFPLLPTNTTTNGPAKTSKAAGTVSTISNTRALISETTVTTSALNSNATMTTAQSGIVTVITIIPTPKTNSTTQTSKPATPVTQTKSSLLITPFVTLAPTTLPLPTATTSVSPSVYASNLAMAQSYNNLFANLTSASPCIAGQIACVNGAKGTCSNGAFVLEQCAKNSKCFALPMENTEGVSVGCVDEGAADAVLGLLNTLSVTLPTTFTRAPTSTVSVVATSSVLSTSAKTTRTSQVSQTQATTTKSPALQTTPTMSLAPTTQSKPKPEVTTTVMHTSVFIVTITKPSATLISTPVFTLTSKPTSSKSTSRLPQFTPSPGTVLPSRATTSTSTTTANQAVGGITVVPLPFPSGSAAADGRIFVTVTVTSVSVSVSISTTTTTLKAGSTASA